MSRSNSKRPRILVIDDEPDVAAYLSMVLETNGFESITLPELPGLETITELQPALICLDIMMPRETGISFYKRLRQDKAFRILPVVIVSGATADGEFEFRDYVSDPSIPPPDCFIEKPIKVDSFIALIKKLIREKQPLKGD